MYSDLEKRFKSIERYLKKLDDETLLYAGNFIIHELNKRDLTNKIKRRKGLFTEKKIK